MRSLGPYILSLSVLCTTSLLAVTREQILMVITMITSGCYRYQKTAVDRYDWHCHANCLMDNQYHLLLETNRASLSEGVKLLNGSYTQ